jgi:hypothetical protein
MKVLHTGHRYLLENFQKINEVGQEIQFIHKAAASDDPTILETIDDGTTNEEVLAVLIDRLSFLQARFPCKENAMVITKLEESLMWLNKRTEDRKQRNVEGRHLA